MIRILILLAMLYGIYLCYYNVNFEEVKASLINAAKNEKTVKLVNTQRAQMFEDNEKAMNE